MADQHIRINFSYVLNEPSTSQVVSRAVRASNRFLCHKPGLIRQFHELDDESFRQRIVLNDAKEALAYDSDTTLITASVGLPELLPRAFQAIAEKKPFEVVSIDQRPHNSADGVSVEFFGAPANLKLPNSLFEGRRIIVAALIVRPGNTTLMLNVSDTGSSAGESVAHVSQDVRSTLEGLIRDFHDQWTPSRALWDQSVEITRPEILAYRPEPGPD
jgi:hypothetical protein